jgi:ankyrin repeat protein
LSSAKRLSLHSILRGGQKSNPQDELIDAAKEGNLNMIRHSINSGADPNKADESGMPAILYAAIQGNLEVFKLLLECESSIAVQGRDGSSALHLASYYGHREIVHHLLNECNASALLKVDVKDQDGSTPLHNAAYKGQCDCASILLDSGADINYCQV